MFHMNMSKDFFLPTVGHSIHINKPDIFSATGKNDIDCKQLLKI